ESFTGSTGDHPAPQRCGVEPHGDDRPDATRPAPFGDREGRSISMETDVGLLRAESGGERLFAIQTNVRRQVTGEAGCVPGSGSLARLRVAQSDAGAGSPSVLCGQLKKRFKGLLHLLLDSCNNADAHR